MENGRKVITIVCTGNVCRSPMAEYLLRHALLAEEAPLCEITVTSAGVSAFPGDPASGNAIRAMEKVGLDLNGHRSQPFSDHLAQVSDLILTMTSGHKDILHQLYPDNTAPVYRFREWVDKGSREVPDPYGGPLGLYVETRDSLAEAVPSIIQFLKKEDIL